MYEPIADSTVGPVAGMAVARSMTRNITFRTRPERDECAVCERPALPGKGFGRLCEVHEQEARPSRIVEDLEYEMRRRKARETSE